MKPKSLDFLKELMGTMSPTGFEVEAAQVWKNEAGKFCEEVRTDTRGNSFALVGKGNYPRIMLAGHIDEIGLIVSHVDDDGFLYFNTLGGWDAQVLVGQRVILHGKKERIRGVIGKKPIHQMKDDEKKQASKFEDLWIDMGFKNKKEAQECVRIGDPAVLDQGFLPLRNNNIACRGVDDRIGAFVVLEVLRKLPKKNLKAEVIAVATVQEEIGHLGAIVGAYGLDPQAAFAVDVGQASDYPTIEKKQIGDHKLGSGPIVARGPMINPVLFEMVAKTAEKDKIPYTIKTVPRQTGTDTDGISVTRSGVPSSLISVPNRYMHSPNEMVNLDDVDNVINLIAGTILKINDKSDFTPSG